MSTSPDRYLSTRGDAAPTSFADALLRGIAPDGGLYMPQAWPTLPADAARPGRTYAEMAREAISPFIGDALPAGALDRSLNRLTRGFDHPAVTPLVELEPGLFVLELFHGPTAAFKDLAMQLVAALSDEALASTGQKLTLLTATSGDTGAAAVRAFAGAERINLIVLHPLDRVSPVQRRQMTTVQADNVLNLAVRGDFDDCQRLVKGLLAEESLRDGRRLSSVNSINWGRLAGQIPYYISATAQLGQAATFVVPTGNFGDAFAGIAAKKMGLPVRGFVAAVNQNDALARAINEGVYARRPAVESGSVSMDVQAPSNFERLVYEASGRDAEAVRAVFETFTRDGSVTLSPDLLAALKAEVSAVSIDEATTKAEIAHAHAAWGRVVCPHTAVALAAARQLDRADGPVVALSTAHPSKFGAFVSDVLGFEPVPAPVIRALGDQPERLTIIDNTAEAALAAVKGFAN
ncbi:MULTISPECIES: threonine synthase [unclassified Brevundimonas]|uniref:threonine synthase n=1 Tax=unclassified Brevundimonas TaxID=2622653 RepID=UPI000CFE1451|nr:MULTISPECIES: threonine synthase [unclassified Brevundimonas]PRA30410.1 threonine synthase [Brevundimonas sp. MYb27]PQZ83313.1 threonine synthase [Brevundimonas sp. MYb31]PRB16154.1 threonine synthase [Brevundimonas sp. MYb52]PRB35235.1 threonine synthase [Brevundimonas sp. MYb46]PRB46130.1 threonine synthase [Brevundimonas sp. MYb33]